MSSSTSSKLSAIGLLSTTLFAAACASGVAASTSDGRREASVDKAADKDHVITRRSCSPANTSVVAADGLLADFSTKKGQVLAAVPPGSPRTTTLTQSTDGGALVVKLDAMPGEKPQFLSTDMLFDGCVDASAFTGIQFSLAGSLSGCSLVYASVDPEHQFVGEGGPYPPQYRISASELTSQPRTITAPFGKPDIQGNPATPPDPSKLSFLQWMVIVPVGSIDGTEVPPCTGSLVIDDVKLYR